MKETFTEQLFISSQVLKDVNISYRQLSYWELKGIIKPILQKQGIRDFKRYTQSDIDTLKKVKNLLDEGYSLPTTDILKEIDKREEAEMALRESREKYRALVESSVDAIFIHDRDGRYLYANQACVKLFGRKPDEIVGKKITDFFTEKKAKEMLEGIRRVFYENNIIHIEYSFSLEGSDRYFSATLAPICDVQGNVVSIMRVAHDITERKRTERKQFLRFEILKTCHQDVSLKSTCEEVVSLIKRYLDCEVVALRLREGKDYPYFINNGFPKDFIKSENHLCVHDKNGYVLKDSNGRPIIACMCGIVINAKSEPDKPFFTKEGSFWTNSTTELLASTTEKDRGATTRNVCNEYGYESVALIPIKSTRDNVGLLQINDKRRNLFTSDIIKFLEELGHVIGMGVERKKGEEALRQSEENYRELADSITDVFFGMDKDLRYTYWNRASEKLTGIKAKDAIGKSIFEIFPDRENTIKTVTVYREVLKTQQPRNFVSEYQLKNKNFFFEINAYPSKNGLSVFVKDITEGKHAAKIGESV